MTLNIIRFASIDSALYDGILAIFLKVEFAKIIANLSSEGVLLWETAI